MEWEYCQLWLIESREDKNKQGWNYNCGIQYNSGATQISRQLATLDSILTYGAFGKAMGLLGAAGWELVSVQHGNKYGGQIPYQQHGLIWDNRVAYFKRPVVPGRAVDEPKLVL